MASLTFVSSFTGASITSKHVTSKKSFPTTRCEMGDSIAPKISIKDTGNPATSSVNFLMQKVLPNTSEATSITGNMSLYVSLRSRINSPALTPTETTTPPAGVSPADYYFPKETRNLAPVISFEYNKSIGVQYNPINPSVGGIEANSVDTIAFWKPKDYKYSAPENADQDEPEVISTAEFEKYYPSRIRNRAPFIQMKKPAGDWDTTAYIKIGSEVVSFNEMLARKLSVKAEDGEPSLAASSTIAKYYNDDFINKAPEIVIVPGERVEFGLEEVKVTSEKADQVLAAASD